MPWYLALLVAVGCLIVALTVAIWLAARMFLAALFRNW
jgi:uncharacterized protein YneF (UPF0154 family)